MSEAQPVWYRNHHVTFFQHASTMRKNMVNHDSDQPTNVGTTSMQHWIPLSRAEGKSPKQQSCCHHPNPLSHEDHETPGRITGSLFQRYCSLFRRCSPEVQQAIGTALSQEVKKRSGSKGNQSEPAWHRHPIDLRELAPKPLSLLLLNSMKTMVCQYSSKPQTVNNISLVLWTFSLFMQVCIAIPNAERRLSRAKIADKRIPKLTEAHLAGQVLSTGLLVWSSELVKFSATLSVLPIYWPEKSDLLVWARRQTMTNKVDHLRAATRWNDCSALDKFCTARSLRNV